jgi:hypothetical protein
MATNPPRRGWRQQASGAAQGKKAQYGWRQEAPVSDKVQRKWSRSTKIGVASATLLVGAGVLIWVVLQLIPVKPVRLVLIGAGYETNLAVPPNVLGRRGLRDLETWVNNNPRDEIKRKIDVHAADLTTQPDALTGAVAGDFKARRASTVIVFVSAHGGADNSGAFLIPQDANPRDPNHRVRIDKLLDQLKLLPEGTKKLLLLDTTQVPALWSFGMVHNDFVRALKDEPKLKEIKNLVVITSSGEDQRSWVSEEWRQTIFAHFVLEGLKGAADQSPTGDRNSRVTVGELYNYVRKQVTHWARHNREALQEPMLIDNGNLAGKTELVAADDGYIAPDPKTIPEFQVPRGLEQAWTECQQLSQHVPAPYVYAPQQWRQYLDTLLRYEQLVRAEDEDSARRLLDELRRVKGNILQAGRLKGDSLQATLAMPAALGWTLPPDKEKKLAQEFDGLWDNEADPDAYKKKLQQWQKDATDKWQRDLLRVRLNGLVVGRATRGTDADLVYASRIIPMLDQEAIGPRPAEAHYLVMLQRDLNAKQHPPGNLLRTALQIRQRAEGAALGAGASARNKLGPLALYSEQVYPWIRQSIEKGDEQRRQAEDLLFASDNKSWTEAGKLLQQPLFDQAETDAVLVRSALHTRDRMLAMLPYYTQWMARRPQSSEGEKLLTGLWKSTHQLSGALAEPERGRQTLEHFKSTGEIEAGAKDFAALEQSFNLPFQDRNPVHQRRWHEIEDALVVPFIEPGQRMELLADSRRISYTLNIETSKASEAGGINPQENAKSTQDAAQRQGRLALAVLGEGEFKRQQAEPGFEQVAGWIERPEEGHWWRSLDKVGEEVGRLFNQLTADAEQLTGTGRQDSLEKARPDLQKAALLARKLDGAAAAGLAVDPVGEYRRLLTHDLLCWQAQRTFLDYWSGEDLKKPYYRVAGGLYVRDAQELVGREAADLTREQKDRRLRPARDIEKQLNVPDEVVVTWFDGHQFQRERTLLHLVADDDIVERIYRVDLPAAAPVGFPVVWATRGRGLKPIDGDTARRVVRTKDEKIIYALEPDWSAERVPQTSSHQLEGVFRGRRFKLETPLRLHERPDVIAYQPEVPRTGRIAVQADDELYRQFGAVNAAIAFVLDCSGSMNPKLNGGDNRFGRVTDALEKVFRRLPAGVTVSLRIYGQDDPAQDNANKGTSRLLWEPHRWDKARIGERMREIRALAPSYGTPLVKSIGQAKTDFPRGFRGARTIVVLTDGADSTFYPHKGPKANLVPPAKLEGDSDLYPKGDTIAKYLDNEFHNSGILINVIGVEVSPQERKQQEEFKRAIEKLGGSYYDVEKTGNLAAILEKAALMQMRFWIEEERTGQQPRQLPQEGADISPLLGSIGWIEGLEEGAYQVRMRTGKVFEQRTRIGQGDALLLTLTRTADGLGFRRDPYADSQRIRNYRRDAKKERQGAWLMAALQNQRRPEGLTILPGQRLAEGVQIMTTLEKDQGEINRKAALQLLKPGFVWFRVTPQGGRADAVPSLRFYPLAGYPAPAWSLDLAPWPRDAIPNLEVYWRDDPPPPAAVLRRTLDFQTPFELVNRPVDAWLVDDQERARIVIESVRCVRRSVEVRPGEILKNVDCLVVRLRYPPGKPFYAKLPETFQTLGEEHRFYDQAGRYTGIFWNVIPARAETLEGLQFVSVEGSTLRAPYRVKPLPLGEPDKIERPQKPGEKR